MKVINDYVYVNQLNLDLMLMKRTCDTMRDLIEHHFGNSQKGYTGESTKTTGVFQAYNFLMYPLPQIHELYEGIRSTFHDINPTDEKHFIQCWLNYYNRDDFIDWHHHWPSEVNSWHGFFCVTCEPSSTTYKLSDGTIVDIESKNNNLVISRSDGDEHRTWPWEYDEPRITIAFDIIPARHLPMLLNHWIPI